MDNYFEILQLRADIKGDKPIREAIEKYMNQLVSKSNRQEISQEDFLAGKKLVEQMKAWVEDKEQVKAHKTAFFEKQANALRAYFATLPNHYEAYKTEIDSWSNLYMISSDDVEKIMKENPDHQIIRATIKPLPKGFLLMDSELKDFREIIDALRASTEIPKKYPWSRDVRDIYDFLAHLANRPVNEIRQEDTPVLLKILKEEGDKMVAALGGNNGPVGEPVRKLIAKIPTVLDIKKPEQRTAYDNSAVYETLRPVFEAIKATPKLARKDEKTAQNFIARIKEKFNNDELALTIYNKEASLQNDPYEPAKVVVSMSCANCGAATNFPNHAEAERGKCANCGAAYYIPCPNCGKLMPASASICTSCDFNVVEYRKVPRYINAAKAALAKGDYSEAKLYLEQALAADPKGVTIRKNPEFTTIQQKIEKGYEEYSKYFSKLTSLMSGKNFMQAKVEAENVKKNFPTLDISSHLKRIQEALDKARSMLPSPTDFSEAAALRCYDILEVVADYLPAKEHLHKVNLSPIERFSVVALQGNVFGVSISWAPSKNSRVSYYLVRNEAHAPKTFSDGIILLKEATQTTYEDSKIEPGKAYFYGVFAAREGVFSPAVSAKFAYFAEVEKLEGLPAGLSASLSYALPTNCVGVRIYRKENAVPAGPNDPAATCICQSTRLPYEDKSVQLDHQYGYLIQAIYMEGQNKVYSNGKSVLVRIERDPSDLNNVVIEKNGGAIVVRYRAADMSSPNPVRLYTIKAGLVERKLHNLITNDELQAYIKDEKLLGSAKAKDGGFTFTLAGDYAYAVALVSMTDSKARVCGLGFVSSIPTLEIDKKKTSIKDTAKAYVMLKDVPQNCFGIYYMVLDAGHTKSEITQEDIKSHMASFVPADSYRREGLIDCRGRAITSGSFKLLILGEFVISGNHVFGQTASTVVSSAGPRTVSYSIKWEKKGLFTKTYIGTLQLNCKGGLPDVRLMARFGATPLSGNDVHSDNALEVTSSHPELQQTGDNYSIAIPPAYCKPGMVFRLFLVTPDDETKVSAADYNSLTCQK